MIIDLARQTYEAKTFSDLQPYMGGVGLGLKLFQQFKIYPVAFTSDPKVEVIAQKVNKSTLIYIFNPAGSFWNSNNKTESVILSLNCKKLGLAGGKVQLQELFTDQIIKTKVKELSQGIFIPLKEMDSKLFLIERK